MRLGDENNRGIQKTDVWSLFFGTFLIPVRTFAALATDPRGVRLGSIAVAVTAVCYTLVYVFLSLGGGAPSSFEPWLAVPKDTYYFYNQFWLAPSVAATWIVAGGTAHLLARGVSGAGTFDALLGVFGFAILSASSVSLIHDLPDSFLGAVSVLDLRWYEVQLNSPTIWRAILLTLYSVALLLLVGLMIVGVKSTHRLKTKYAVWVGIIAAVVYQGMFVAFNR